MGLLKGLNFFLILLGNIRIMGLQDFNSKLVFMDLGLLGFG